MVSDYVNSFGFGQITGVDLQNEMAGSVLPVSEWRNINRATISFGQGIAVTPLQVLTAYTAIANADGALSHPHMVKAVIRPDGTREELTFVKGRTVLKPTTAEKIRQMLVAVIVKNHQKAAVAGYKIGGKSGTAQIPNPDGAGYIENAYNHSFIGMGPIDDPRFIVLAKLDQPNIEKVGRFAETTASPLFSQVASFLLNYYQIAPTNR
jgi:stage V sporulation protein D (sporulation-specific penicillin-binding protein)